MTRPLMSLAFRADRRVHMGQRGACAQKRPFDVHGHFSLTCCARFGYESARALAIPIWEFGGGRERPPFLPPGSAQRGRLMCTGVPSHGGVSPVTLIPGGKAFGSPERVAVRHGTARWASRRVPVLVQASVDGPADWAE